MDTIKTNTATPQQFLTIALMVLLACFALFSLDKDTHSFADLLKPGNLFALILYFTPTFVISLLLFRRFSKKHDRTKSLVLSLVAGIPISFALVISILLLFMR